MTAQELDQHIDLKLEEWLDINSARLQEMDDNATFTRYILNIGLKDGFLRTDDLGRVYGQNDDGVYYPYHFEANGKLYGIRLSSSALN